MERPETFGPCEEKNKPLFVGHLKGSLSTDRQMWTSFLARVETSKQETAALE